jgi:hypothetical protein
MESRSNNIINKRKISEVEHRQKIWPNSGNNDTRKDKMENLLSSIRNDG